MTTAFHARSGGKNSAERNFIKQTNFLFIAVLAVVTVRFPIQFWKERQYPSIWREWLSQLNLLYRFYFERCSLVLGDYSPYFVGNILFIVVRYMNFLSPFLYVIRMLLAKVPFLEQLTSRIFLFVLWCKLL